MKLKKKAHRLVAGISAVVMAAAAVTISVPTMTTEADSDLGLDNYAKLLQYSLYFYDANMCGSDVGETSAFSWRDDCHTGNVVCGGFHDAGDGIQCGLTTGFTASTMGWMYYEYGEQFDKSGTTQHYKVLMDRFCKLFKDSTTLSSNGEVTSLVYEMGDDGRDHGEWLPPESMGSYDSDQTYSTSNSASNVAAQYAAALAQNYINFGNEEDLTYATALYNFATKYRKVEYNQSTYSEQFENCQDDISWAAGWMYLATQEDNYLQENAKYTNCSSNWTDDYFYGNVKLGAAIINAEITGNWSYVTNYIDQKVNANQNQFYVMNSWGSARHNTLMQICAMVTTKYQEQSGKDYADWCQKQMNMILGDNNANVCLVVGYNDRSATSPHHRAASNLKSGSSDGWNAFNSWDGSYASSGGHTLYGALCGGPTSSDFNTYQFTAKDATSNEVALDYQVGLVGAAAGLYAYYNTGSVVAEIGDEVTVYPDEVAVANGGTVTTTTTETTTTTTTTETTPTTEYMTTTTP
ncbi:MAG: glycoside hydrolase family 9 protein [Oscillospiraceae bacterium]|nr:glycoside hydrolase family 9 protein [Oscillospiraceae bacterium]